MFRQIGKFDCWIFWEFKSARIPLDIPAIEYYRAHGVEINVVGQYYND